MAVLLALAPLLLLLATLVAGRYVGEERIARLAARLRPRGARPRVAPAGLRTGRCRRPAPRRPADRRVAGAARTPCSARRHLTEHIHHAEESPCHLEFVVP